MNLFDKLSIEIQFMLGEARFNSEMRREEKRCRTEFKESLHGIMEKKLCDILNEEMNGRRAGVEEEEAALIKECIEKINRLVNLEGMPHDEELDTLLIEASKEFEEKLKGVYWSGMEEYASEEFARLCQFLPDKLEEVQKEEIAKFVDRIQNKARSDFRAGYDMHLRRFCAMVIANARQRKYSKELEISNLEGQLERQENEIGSQEAFDLERAEILITMEKLNVLGNIISEIQIK